MPRAENAMADARCAFEIDVDAGLSAPVKWLSCRWLYDARGSELFELITDLPEYYPTRTETAILRAGEDDLRDFAGASHTLVEYGAGAGIKTEILLDALRPAEYVPVDVAGDFLAATTQRISSRYPHLKILPVIADFTSEFELPPRTHLGPRVGFFPGSTIGNLDPKTTEAFLWRMRRQLGSCAKAIIGVDLIKHPSILVPAYDDAAGVTAEFNLNLLRRINRELGGDFDLSKFKHQAVWNAEEAAIEMRLVSLVDQLVRVAGQQYTFRKGESIHTESSRKYSFERFSAVAAESGWVVEKFLTDERSLFGVFLLSVDVRSEAHLLSDRLQLLDSWTRKSAPSAVEEG